MATHPLRRGDTWIEPFAWKQGAADGDPVPLTGYSARMHLRDRSGRLIRDMTDCLTIDEANGTVWVNASTAITSTFPVGKLEFDIELTDPAGVVRSTDTQILDVDKDITLPEGAV